MRAGRSAYCVFSVSGGDHRPRFFNFGNPVEFFDPTPSFCCCCCKQNTYPKSTLGAPLCDAWVTLGSRLGHPIPIPGWENRQRVATPKWQNATAVTVASCFLRFAD